MADDNKKTEDATSGPDEVQKAVAKAMLRRDLVRHGELVQQKWLNGLTTEEQAEFEQLELRLTSEDAKTYDPLLDFLKKSATSDKK